MKMNRRLWRRVLVLGVLGYGFTCAYLWSTQEEKIFKPLAELASDPGRLGMEHENREIPVGEGDQRASLDAFWVPSADVDAPAVLYLHGQDDNIGKNLFHTLHLHQSGFNVLVVDYRGFGESHGFTPSETSVNMDANAAWVYLTKTLGFEDEDVFIYGHSLGAAIAVELATKQGGAGGLILESGFTSAKAMANLKIPLTHLLPVNALLKHKFDSIEKIGKVEMPILFIHGKMDTKVPCWMTEALHEKAGEPQENLLLVKGGGHADCCLVGRVDHRKKLQTFVSKSRARFMRISMKEGVLRPSRIPLAPMP